MNPSTCEKLVSVNGAKVRDIVAVAKSCGPSTVESGKLKQPGYQARIIRHFGAVMMEGGFWWPSPRNNAHWKVEGVRVLTDKFTGNVDISMEKQVATLNCWGHGAIQVFYTQSIRRSVAASTRCAHYVVTNLAHIKY